MNGTRWFNLKERAANHQLKMGIVITYISMAINMVVQLVYTPVMIRILGQSEYGLYTLVASIVSYLSLFNLGFTGAYLRFYSIRRKDNDEKEIAKLNGMFMSVFLFMSIVALLTGMILSHFPVQIFGSKLSASEIAKSQVLMRILVINIALSFPSGLLDSIVSAHEKFIFQRLITLAGVITNPLLCLPLLLLGFGSIAVVMVSTVITLLKLTVNIVYCKNILRVNFDYKHFEFPVIKEISEFSFFLFLNMIIDQINWSVDKYILGRVSGTIDVAIYGVGANINSLFITFSTAISSVFAPRVNRIATGNAVDKFFQFTQLFIRVGRIQYLLLMLIASGFVFFGEYFIVNIYATVGYIDAYIVALLLMLPAFVPLIQNLGIEIQRALNKHRIRSLIYTAMAFINVLISIPLAMKWGPIGSALGTAIGLVLVNGIFINIYYYKGLKLDILSFWKEIMMLSRGFVIPVFAGIIMKRCMGNLSYLSYILFIIIYIAVYITSMWLFGMNEYEKALFSSPIQKLLLTVKKQR